MGNYPIQHQPLPTIGNKPMVGSILIQLSISIPLVSVQTIRFLSITVTLSTSADH